MKQNRNNNLHNALQNNDNNITETPADKTSRQLANLVSIGIALSAEKNHDKLMEMIITEARRITNSDGGTLYLLDDGCLRMKILHNRSMNVFKGGKGEKVDLPAVPLNPAYVSSCVAINGKAMSFDDVYEMEDFDFSGTRKYDNMTGYRTTSMLVIPLKDHLNEVIGVLQLINAMDENNDSVISFDPEDRTIVEALASLAAIALTNMNLIEEVELLFESFAQVIVTAIDKQTPYNATHTRKVSNLACIIAEKINETNEGPFKDEYFDEERLKSLVMSGWLHDIGKIATPLEVMNKASRLDQRLPLVIQRIDYAIEKEQRLSLQNQLELLKSGKEKEVFQEEKELHKRVDRLSTVRDLVVKTNNADTFVDDDLRKQLTDAGKIMFYDEEDTYRCLLDKEELDCLLIPKGTLTTEERQIIEEHVVITENMLSKVPFSRKLASVPMHACMHHESLDGKGYPRGYCAGEIPLEARILAVADIFDALTASDRPYRKKIPEERAAAILEQMAKEGKIDFRLVELLSENCLWERMEYFNNNKGVDF